MKGASRVRRKAARKRPATARRRDLAAQPILFTDATTVFVMDPTRSGAVLARHAGIDEKTGQLTDAGDGGPRRLVISSDF